MKKIISVLLVFILSVCLLSSCGKSETSKPENTEKVEHENYDVYSQYKEDQVLFICQDRYDVEGDRYTPYSYNYKGELVNGTQNSYIGYFSENGLAPAMDQKTGKIGFVNKSGEFVIEPIYDDAAPFSKFGIALVAIKTNDNTKCGFIDSQGNQIVDFIYDDAFSFFDSGYAVVSNSVKDEGVDEYGEPVSHRLYGVIDKKGNLVVKQEYSNIYCVYDKYFVGNKDKTRMEKIYDFNGKVLEDKLNNYADLVYEITKGEKLSDKEINEQLEGKEIYRTKYETNSIKRTVEKRGGNKDLTVKHQIFDGKKFVNYEEKYDIYPKNVATTISGLGFGVEKDGKIKIPFEYDNIYESNGYFVCVKYQDEKKPFPEQRMDIYNKNFKCTAKDLDYNYDINNYLIYHKYKNMPEGFFPVFEESENIEDNLIGIIDESGNIIIDIVFYRGITPCSYEDTGKFPEMP